MRKKQIFILCLLMLWLAMEGCGRERQREEEEVFVRNTDTNSLFNYIDLMDMVLI